MNTYQRKTTVDAARWFDTDEGREMFATWFELVGEEFVTRGPVVILPEGTEVLEGGWILRDDDGEFVVLGDDRFRERYAVCSKVCYVAGCTNLCGFADAHDGLCACPRKIAALRSAGVDGAWIRVSQ